MKVKRLKENLNEQEILDLVVDYSEKNYTTEDYFDWYYTGQGPKGYSIEFEGDAAWRVGYNWIDSYPNVKSIKEVLNNDFYNYMSQNEGVNKDSVVNIKDFVPVLIYDYLWDYYMDGSVENGVLFDNPAEGIYFMGVILDEEGEPDQGVIHVGLRDDPYLNLISFEGLEET